MATITTTEGHQVQVVEEVEVEGDLPTIRESFKEHISLLFLITLFNFYLIEKGRENIFGYVLIVITQIGHCVLVIVSQDFFYFFVLCLFLTLFTTDEKGVQFL